jgi:uncharacterized membrane protein YoaK (UPF0700 family)
MQIVHSKALPFVLSVIAGATDTIGFLGLGGLFTAHVTGNLVILAAYLVSSSPAMVAVILSVPVFMLVLVLTRLFAAGCEAAGRAPLQPLLLLQLLLLAGFLTLGAAAGPRVHPNAAIAIVAGMFGVSAMAVQNALVQLALRGAPTTAVMTSNVTRLMLDIGALVVARSAAERAGARARAQGTWPAVVGFAVGCGLGAGGEAIFGLRSLAVPTILALLALCMSPGRTTGADP